MNAVADACTIAATPNAAASVQTSRPLTTPKAVAIAGRRPYIRAFFVTRAVSGPGATITIAAMPRNAVRCSPMAGDSRRFGVGQVALAACATWPRPPFARPGAGVPPVFARFRAPSDEPGEIPRWTTIARATASDPDDPVILPAEETRIHEVREVPVPPPGADAEFDVVQEERRTRVLPDGTVVEEGYRVEQRSTMRDRLPWIIIGVLAAILIAGIATWYFTRSDTKPVPGVVGLSVDDAVTKLQADGFKVEIVRQSNDQAAGVVFGQNPAANTDADEGSSVRVLVSKGPSTATVPNAVGLRQSDARSQLVEAGFTVTTAQVFSDQPSGVVVAQDPAAGEKVAPGTKVRLNVSKGSGEVDVPSVVGRHARRRAIRPRRPGLQVLGEARRVRPAGRHGGGAEPVERHARARAPRCA